MRYIDFYNIAGTGSVKTDYIFPVNIHYGPQRGDASNDAIFCRGMCRTDFADLAFKDAAGNNIPFYMHGSQNCEIVYDGGLGEHNVILADGSILSSSVPGQTGVVKSTDNGATWTEVYAYSGANILFVDSRGYLYVNHGYLLKRSTDGASFSTVLDMSAVSGAVQWHGIDEDSDGRIFVGRYQGANDVAIFRSVDDGATFTRVFTNTSYQHVHGLACDPYTGYIYAGIDGNMTGLLRSTDHGDTWAFIAGATGGGKYDVTQFVFAEGYRLIGTGYGGGEMGIGVLKTTDDVTFTPVLKTHHSVQGLRKVGNAIYAGSVSAAKGSYPQVYRSVDDGATWETVWFGGYDNSYTFTGFERWQRAGTPTGDAYQLILGAFSGAGKTYKSARLYDGGDHYQSVAWLKIPSLPARGLTIEVFSTGSSESLSDADIFAATSLSGVSRRYMLNEGTGTTIDDAIGSADGTLTLGTGAWVDGLLRGSTMVEPQVLKSGKRLSLVGDGCVSVAGSAAFPSKNFSALCWFKSTVIPSESKQIFGKGFNNYWWGLCIYSGTGQLAFYCGYGSAYTNYQLATPSGPGVCDGKAHMVGCILNNSSPAKLSFVIDGVICSASNVINGTTTLSYDPSTLTRLFTIGQDAANNRGITAEISDVQMYDGVLLTAAQVRMLYEGRFWSGTEALIAATPCDGILPTSAQPCKSHALPIGVGKITIFEGVASSAQIEEAK